MYKNFRKECNEYIKKQSENSDFNSCTNRWVSLSYQFKYMYNYEVLGRPIIQYPQDMVAMQELIWSIKPDLIVETGIAHGGSLILNASMLALLDMVDAIESDKTIYPKASRRKVLGIDIDIRAHNRAAIEAHPMACRIQMIHGSSTAPEIIAQVKDVAKDYQRILVCLDSNHTHEHVLAELEAYTPLVTPCSYCVVFDTIIEDLPDNFFPDSPWSKGNNPKTAVWEFLRNNDRFEVDKEIENKLLITAAPDGYLKCTKD